MNRTSSLTLALLCAAMTAREAHAQQRYTASGGRLLTVTQRVPDSEGDRHSLRTRIQPQPIARRAVRCAPLNRGEPFGVPVPMTDGTLTLVTRAPTGLAWFADGALVRQHILPGNIQGTAVEGADGRVVIVDDSPAIRAYSPDGTLRAVLPLPAAPIYGASALNDGTLLVPLSAGVTSDLAVVSADLTQQTRLHIPGIVQNQYFYRGHNGSLWFNTQSTGPFWISGDRPAIEPLAFARTAVAAWQLDEDTIAVQFGNGPSELRFTSRNGVVRATVPFVDQIFLLPRGHLALAQQYVADSSGGATSTATSPTTGPRPGPTVVRPGIGRIPTAPQPTHTELVVYDRRGTAVTRTLLPFGRLLSVLLDPDDAPLAFGVNGHAYAIDPGGTVRWDADLGISPTQDVIALPDGGFALSVLRPRPGVCTVGG
ncbi:MAG: hypothetical protein U0269_12650 [Polyangiales bacterium]